MFRDHLTILTQTIVGKYYKGKFSLMARTGKPLI